jgi:kynurenine formamidase
MRTLRLRILLLSLPALLLGACRGSNHAPLPSAVIELSPPITPDLNLQRLGSRALQFLGTDGRVRSTPLLPEDPTLAFGLSLLTIPSMTGSYLDAPARLLRGGDTPYQIPAEHLFGRARVVDLRWHDRHSPIQITDLELKPIEEGEIVLLFLGYEPPRPDEWPVFAPLSVQASEYLVAKKILALGTDLPALVPYDELESRLKRQLPPEMVWAEYLPLFQARIPLIAGLVNLDGLVGERDVAFAAFPLPLAEGTGSPTHAIGLIY